MNIEQLQLILNTLQGMGVEGKSAFIWWLVFDKALPIIGWLCTFIGLMWIAARIIAAVRSNVAICDLRDEMNIGSSGYLTDGELAEVVRKVRELLCK